MPRIRLVLEYNGRNFHGWQFQPGVRTIQGELEKALELLFRYPVRVHASGRTDSGVHARGQVVHFTLEEQSPDLEVLAHSLSSLLKNEVAVIDWAIVPESFHARRSATKKQYSYTILNRLAPPTIDYGQVWHIARPISVDRMRQEAALLVGEHNFRSFQGAKCLSKRLEKTIFESEIFREKDCIFYRVVGSGFLKHMVRNIVGTLVLFGKEPERPESILDILAARDRQCAGTTAPPYGLRLDWVAYEDEGKEADFIQESKET